MYMLQDGHLECITTAKHRIELLNIPMKQIHSVPYRAGSKTRELNKSGNKQERYTCKPQTPNFLRNSSNTNSDAFRTDAKHIQFLKKNTLYNDISNLFMYVELTY